MSDVINFIVNKSRVNERFDPFYIYHKIHTNLETNFNSMRLGSLVTTFSGGTPSKNNPDFWNGTIPWISPKDFEGLDLDKFDDSITKEGLENSSTKIAPENSVIIVVRSGVLAHSFPVCINNKPVAINQDLKVLIPSDKNLLPRYLAVYFYVFGKKLLPLITKRSTTVHSINTEQFERLQIPVPPLEAQKKIVELIDSAKEKKKSKEVEAEKKLESIDNYLLSELGIEIPEKDNSINNRIFITRYKKISSKRYDPKPYEKNSDNLKKAILNSNFPKVQLKHLIVKSDSGRWGRSIESNISEKKYQKCLVIRATEFDNRYNLNLDNSRVEYRFIKKSKLKRLDIQANDLLIEKSGGSPDQPVGRVAILRHEIINNNKLCYSNFVYKIRVDESRVLPEYLFNFLKTIHNVKLTEIMQSQTSGIRNLIMSEYFNQQIILPDLPIQRKISDEINKRRFEARELEKEANLEVENAKSKIEGIILNN